MTTWQKAVFDEERKSVKLDKGRMIYIPDFSCKEFLKQAGEKRAYMKNNDILLFYNSETGDTFIPRVHTSEEVNEIKGEFLKFISKDTHDELFEDVDYKVVEE